MKRSKRLKISWGIWRTSRSAPSKIILDQQTQLGDLVEFARTNSPLYRQLYKHLPNLISDIEELPAVTKPELMADFDDWVTDPAVTRNNVEAFIADKTSVAKLFFCGINNRYPLDAPIFCLPFLGLRSGCVKCASHFELTHASESAKAITSTSSVICS